MVANNLCGRSCAGVGGVLTLSWMLLMSDHCADNLAWAQLSADERHMYTVGTLDIDTHRQTYIVVATI